MGYKECFENIVKDRNSYSKTDLEATFMRMKEDHTLNGQLKPAYNVQIAVENYFIVHGYVSNDRTDYNTLIPVLKKHHNGFGDTLEAVTADSGYCSEKNLVYLKENGIRSYIKLQDHEKRKTRAYKEDIGKHYWHTPSLRMSTITSAMTEGSCAISRQKDTLEISRKTKVSSGSTTGQRSKFIQSSCCMR